MGSVGFRRILLTMKLSLADENFRARTGAGKYSFSLFSADHEQD